MDKKRISPATLALLKTLAVLATLCVCGSGLIFWAKNDETSSAAKEIRKALGLQEPVQQPIAITSEASSPEPEPIPPPPPEPTPIDIEPQKLDPVEFTFEQLVQASNMWPETLLIRLENNVPILYNGTTYGHMRFTPGQAIQLESMSTPGRITCRVNGNYINIPARETNIVQWFYETHGESYYLVLPAYSTKTKPQASHQQTTDEQKDHLIDVQHWCYLYYDISRIEKKENSLVVYWNPKRDIEIDFAMEARQIARYYLLSQGNYGGHDTYASCEIYHSSTGHLLGSGAIFIPSLAAQAMHPSDTRQGPTEQL